MDSTQLEVVEPRFKLTEMKVIHFLSVHFQNFCYGCEHSIKFIFQCMSYSFLLISGRGDKFRKLLKQGRKRILHSCPEIAKTTTAHILAITLLLVFKHTALQSVLTPTYKNYR